MWLFKCFTEQQHTSIYGDLLKSSVCPLAESVAAIAIYWNLTVAVALISFFQSLSILEWTCSHASFACSNLPLYKILSVGSSLSIIKARWSSQSFDREVLRKHPLGTFDSIQHCRLSYLQSNSENCRLESEHAQVSGDFASCSWPSFTWGRG